VLWANQEGISMFIGPYRAKAQKLEMQILSDVKDFKGMA